MLILTYMVVKNRPDSIISYLMQLFINSPFNIPTSKLLRYTPITLILFISTTPFIRHHWYEIFYYIHRLVIPLSFFYIFDHAPRLALIFRLPLFLYVVDLIMRGFSLLTHSSHIVSCRCERDIIILDIAVRSRFLPRRPFGRLVGAVIHLIVPRISWIQSHPLSVAYSRNNHLICYVKIVGKPSSWTHQLAKLASEPCPIRVFIEGPYCMEHNREIAEQGIPAAVSTYDLLRVTTPTVDMQYISHVQQTYGSNVLFVAGGVGVAGISSYMLDLIHSLERSPESQRYRVTVTVIVVVAEPEHLQAMRPVLSRSQQLPFITTHLYCTYRSNSVLAATLPRDKDACEIPVKKVELSDIEMLNDDGDENTLVSLRYTVGRPPLDVLLQTIPYQPVTVFCCGPVSLTDSLFATLINDNRMFSFHSEVFDL